MHNEQELNCHALLRQTARSHWTTATGSGLRYKAPLEEKWQSCGRPIPAKLRVRDDHVWKHQYDTTTGVKHDDKVSYAKESGLASRQAPGLNNLEFQRTLLEKLQMSSGVPMHPRTTEYHANYGYKVPDDAGDAPYIAAPNFPRGDWLEFQPSVTDGTRCASRHLDPYCSETRFSHTEFTKEELSGYPRDDIVTFWSAEGYPKVKGFGPKAAKDITRSDLTDKPMRDVSSFKGRTTIRNLPRRLRLIPNRGMESETHAQYPKRDLDPRSTRPHDCHPVIAQCSPWEVLCVPGMYRAESTIIGSGWPVRAVVKVS